MEKLEYLKVLVDLKRVSGNQVDIDKRITDTCISIEKEIDIKRGGSNG